MKRSGFTIVEVMVALSLTGVVVLLAHRLVTIVTISAHALTGSRKADAQSENARRWLRSAFLSLDVGGRDGEFLGHPNSVGFSTWLEQAEGWSARRGVTIRLDQRKVVAEQGGTEIIVLADSVDALAFDYLLEPGARTKWVQQWLSPISAPLAVRIRLSRKHQELWTTDTLLLLIKERG